MSNGLGILDALVQKISWHTQRQQVLAENIANADTPDYKPNDLVSMDFKALLQSSSQTKSTSEHPAAGRMMTTSPTHIGAQQQGTLATAKNKPQRVVYETAPAGNSVVIEEQMIKLSNNMMEHGLASNAYAKFMGLLRTALGNNR